MIGPILMLSTEYNLNQFKYEILNHINYISSESIFLTHNYAKNKFKCFIEKIDTKRKKESSDVSTSSVHLL